MKISKHENKFDITGISKSELYMIFGALGCIEGRKPLDDDADRLPRSDDSELAHWMMTQISEYLDEYYYHIPIGHK